jgi:PAS domain S-box-containing protein
LNWFAKNQEVIMKDQNKSKAQLIAELQELRGQIKVPDSAIGRTPVEKSGNSISVEKYHILFNTVAEAIFLLNAETADIIEVNDAAVKLYQYSRSELIAMNAIELTAEPEKSQATLHNNTGNIPLRYHHKKDGTIFPVEINYSNYRDEDQTVRVAAVRDISEHAQAERALRESENKYRTLFENMVQGAFWQDADGTVSGYNNAVLQLFGLTGDQFLGKTSLDPHWKVIHEDGSNFPGDQHPSMQALTSGKPVLGVVAGVYNPKKKEYIWLIIDAFPQFREDEKKPYQVFVILQDITESKNVNQKLVESEHRLTRVMDGSQLGYWDWEIKTGKVQRNERWAEMLGYTLPEIELNVKQWTDLHHPDDKAAAWKSISDHLEGRTPVHRMEYRMRCKNGEYKWILDQASIVEWDDEGKPLRMSGTHTDVTERKKAEENLRESETKYRTLIEQLDDAIYVLFDGRFELINHKFEQLFGVTLEDVQKPDFDFIDLVASHSRPLIEERRKRFEAGEPLDSNYEFTALSTDGRRLEVEASVYYIKYKDGWATQGIIRDVTERKNMEEQLRRSQRLETIGTLAGGIAHDFNNILTPIMGYADLALSNVSATDPLHNDLEFILQGAYRAKELVEQILVFSRQVEKDRRPVGLQHVVEEALKLLRPSIPSTIQIRQHLDPGCDNIMADPSQIHQIIMNLCTNAFHAMEQNGGTLTIGLQQVQVDAATAKIYPNLEPAQYARLSIHDTGTGMEDDTLRRIFEPFFTTKEPGKGTGMGLSVVHGIVRAHYGEIIVNSEPGQGTAFHIYLPVTRAESTAEPEFPQPVEGGIESVLVVDDEPSVGMMMKRMLEQCGYTVVVSGGSYEALQLFKKEPERFQLVLTDLTMPGMTGLELARKINRLKKDVAIIMMTGYGENVSRHVLKDHGIAKIIGKPIRVRQIATAIRSVLDNNSKKT